MENFKEIEKKWNQVWLEKKTYKVLRDRMRPPFYAYVGYNSPSIDGYIKADCLSRYMRMNGYNVLFPALKENITDIVYGIGMDLGKTISESFLRKAQKSLLMYLLENNGVKKEYLGDSIYYRASITSFYHEVAKMNLPPQTIEDKTQFFGLREGYNVVFQIPSTTHVLKIFITELEHLFLSSFVVVSYADKVALEITNEDEKEDVEEFILHPIVNDLVFTGNFIYNPITDQNMPIFVGDVKETLLGVPSLNETALAYASRYDLEVMSMDYFDDFSLHLRKQALDALTKQDMASEETVMDLEEIDLAIEKDGKIDYNPVFDNVRFMLAPISSSIDLDINILDYKDEINRFLPIDLFVFEDGSELLGSLFMHHLFHNTDFIHNNMFAKKIVFQNPKVVHSNEYADMDRLLVFTGLEESVCLEMLKTIWHIYSFPMSKTFIENDRAYEKLKKDVKSMYEKRDFNMVLANICRFISLVNEKKGFSESQALGLIKMLSPIIPYMAEEIYCTVFNQISTIAYEDYPL